MEKKIITSFISKLGLLNITRRLHRRYIYHKIKLLGNVDFPTHFVFEPTIRCNLSCKMCFYSSKKMHTIKRVQDLSLEQIKRIIDKLSPIEYFGIIGGEPFMKPELFEILDYLREKKIPIWLSTNGTLINDEGINKLFRNDNIIGIDISIDGTRELHNSIRGSNRAFDVTTRNIKLLNEKFPVSVVVVILEENLNYLTDIIYVIKELKLKNITFEYERRYTAEDIETSAKMMNIPAYFIPMSTRKTSKPNYSLKELKKSLSDAEKKAIELGVNLSYFPPDFKENITNYYNRKLRRGNTYICGQLFTCRIDSEGNVVPCFAIRKRFGNLLESSLEDIWNSKEYRNFRRRLLSNNLLPICETCMFMQRIK